MCVCNTAIGSDPLMYVYDLYLLTLSLAVNPLEDY